MVDSNQNDLAAHYGFSPLQFQCYISVYEMFTQTLKLTYSLILLYPNVAVQLISV